MFLNNQSVFIWEAHTLENSSATGIIKSGNKQKAKRCLQSKGFYNLNIVSIPDVIISFPLKLDTLLSFINALILMLTSGMSLKESLEMIQLENRSMAQRYICYHLLESLHKGLSIKESFMSLANIFPAFFITIIEISEKSNQLLKGLYSSLDYYQKKQQRHQELNKITRYPKVVFTVSLILIIAVIVFIIPMFQNIYRLFGDELPLVTKILVALSKFVHQSPLYILTFLGIFIFCFTAPVVKSRNPLVRLIQKVKNNFESKEDPYVYALSMKMQLENGQALVAATKNAALCISKANHMHAEKISAILEEGYGLAYAFAKITWFPPVFSQLISTAEKAGRLALGFDQIAVFLDQQRSDRFSFWNKFLEPVMMICLGAFVLTILLAIYLPIFDLGNRVG